MIYVSLKPYDLRRHAATYASRSGVPIEIVSKIILRHANLSTTQRYLGKVSDTEAIHFYLTTSLDKVIELMVTFSLKILMFYNLDVII